MQYEAMVIADLKLTANSDEHARNIINSVKWPAGITDSSLDIRLKRIGTPDKRLIAHIPNCPRAQLKRMMTALGPRRLLLVALCVNVPQHRHTLVKTIIDNPAFKDNTTSEDLAVDLAGLLNDGWIIPVSHNVELDSFGSQDVRAMFSALATGH